MPNQITTKQLLKIQLTTHHLIIDYCAHLIHQVKNPVTDQQQTTLIEQQNHYLNTWFSQLPDHYQNSLTITNQWMTKLRNLKQKTQKLLNDPTWLTTDQLNEKRFNHHYLNYLQQVKVIEKFIDQKLLKTKSQPPQPQPSLLNTQNEQLKAVRNALFEIAKATGHKFTH